MYQKIVAALKSNNILKFDTVVQAVTIGIKLTYDFFSQSKLAKELQSYLKELDKIATLYPNEKD